MVDTSDEWIVQRTGIKERRIAGPHESTATLAQPRGHPGAAVGGAGAQAPRPDHLRHRHAGDGLADDGCFVAASLGLDATPAFDLGAACSGFLFALDQAAACVKCGRSTRTCS